MYFIRVQWDAGGFWYMGVDQQKRPYLPMKERGFDSAGMAYTAIPCLLGAIDRLEKLEVASWTFFDSVYDDEQEAEPKPSGLRVQATVREILDRGVWDEFCELKGINPWARNEGRMDDDEEIFSFTLEEAKQLRLIP